MAYYHIRFFSNSLKRNTSFEMFLPNDVREDIPHEDTVYSKRKMKTLFLLHGYTGCAENWVPEYLAQKYNFAVVMPNGENAFWLDGISTGRQFCTFVGVELVDYIRKTFGLAMDADETYIMGMSMGGFGALHTALYYPEKFGKLAALSSALIVHEIAHMKEGGGNPVANYAYYHECFGDLETVGTEDFLLENNRAFHAFLENIGVEHLYLESSGGHDMTFWSEYAVKFVEKMFA